MPPHRGARAICLHPPLPGPRPPLLPLLHLDCDGRKLEKWGAKCTRVSVTIGTGKAVTPVSKAVTPGSTADTTPRF